MPTMNEFDLYDRLKSKDDTINTINAIFLTAIRELDDYGDFMNNVFLKLDERHSAQKPISDAGLRD
jgi:CheY-like chemotaxis protein